jgi:hypothetical protein
MEQGRGGYVFKKSRSCAPNKNKFEHVKKEWVMNVWIVTLFLKFKKVV